MMKYYVAPLEGITGHIYRRIHHRHFPGADKYFIPFIEPKPNSKKIFSGRERQDLLPENNEGITVVPQILTNKWEDFVWTARHLREYGYTEVNLNLGCPSKTVVSKGRGAGFLEKPGEVDAFLEQVCSALDMEISVKTRIGKYEPEEFHRLLSIYEKYPLKELIVHPRTQRQFYGGVPDLEAFSWAAGSAKTKLCYNGDIYTTEDAARIQERFPQVQTYMCGRGVLRNPALLCELKGGERVTAERVRAFHDELYAAYQEEMSGETNTLFKMKEQWCYLMDLFEDTEKYAKALRKSKHLREYEAAVNGIFSECSMKDE